VSDSSKYNIAKHNIVYYTYLMTTIYYMRMAMEKDAGLGSFAAKIVPMAKRVASGIGRFASGTKAFAKHPIKTTGRSMIAKPGTKGKNIAGELGFGAKWGGGFAAAGIVGAPLFTSRNI